MVYPTKSTRQFDYLSYQNSNPTRPLPGDKVNADLNSTNNSVGEIVDFLKTTLRSDGRLADNTVGLGQLDDSFKLGFSYPSTWAPHTEYLVDATVFYQNKFFSALVEHTSTDVFDASKWQEIVDFGAQSVADAAASAVAAGASALAAAASETNAATSETNAAASAASATADAAAVASHVGQAIASSISALAAVDTAVFDAAYLSAPMRTGVWVKKLVSDYTADIAADTLNGFTLTSTDNGVYVWVRDIVGGEYHVNWFRTPGASKTDDTAAVKSAIEAVPSGAKLKFGCLEEYALGEISATTRGHIHIDFNGAFLVNTTQVATGIGTALPILRVFAQTQDYDVTVENGMIEGPRLTTDTTVGTGGYGGDPFAPGPGYSSCLDIPIGRTITVRNMVVSGAYYAGIEAHYAISLLMENCNVSNCGYSGLHLSDAITARALNNNIDDIGTTAPDDGYGITFGTSYNDPDYVYGIKTCYAIGNRVTRCKRKSIDVHDGLRAIVTDNFIKGFGYAAIYSVGEGASKNAADAIIANNHIYGDPSFLSGVTNNSVIFVGPALNATTNANLNVHNNHISGVDVPVGIYIVTPPSGSITAVSVAVTGNTFDSSTFSAQAIRSEGTTLLKSIVVANNVINADVSSPHIYITFALDALVMGNVCRGTTSASTVAQFSNVTNPQSVNNMLNGVLGT